MRPGAWWQDAVFYQVYVRSFADSDGDGVGDLEGIHSRLGYLELLGVDALWLTPFYRSPMADHGYDIADPRDVDPMFGTLGDFDVLLTEAHKRGIKVTVDVVPNHTSNQHAWFKSAMAAKPGSPERDRYIFRDGVGPTGEDPPNALTQLFGGSSPV
ncbi:alpha-amylase family glycosyl hydrolase, partial [Amycolatopsis lexingtonensis]|uniref:alpha-amylase family glycosyl hydrolase n=1 Tax=Amycolatopsis lexingtonensis TaxID=218822 RepID=UPI00201298AD